MPKIIKSVKGAYTAADITVDSSGRVIAASSGSGGDTLMRPVLAVEGPASGTYTATSNANKLHVYIRGGGGAGGNAQATGTQPGGPGGTGGCGFFSFPISQPYSVPYVVGAGGDYQYPGNTAPSGQNSTLNTNDAVGNAGSGGGKGMSNDSGATGADGTAPGAEFDFSGNKTAMQSFVGNSAGTDYSYAHLPIPQNTLSHNYTRGANTRYPIRLGGQGGGAAAGHMQSSGALATGAQADHGTLVIFENLG
jgi:hypothetical protein